MPRVTVTATDQSDALARFGGALADLTGLVLAIDPACCPDAEDGCC